MHGLGVQKEQKQGELQGANAACEEARAALVSKQDEINSIKNDFDFMERALHDVAARKQVWKWASMLHSLTFDDSQTVMQRARALRHD